MGEFAVAPWVPVSGFVQSNVEALERLFEYIQRHFPHTAAGLDFDLTAGFPDDPEQRATIASYFDTSQTTEDNASDLAIKPTKRLGELLCDIHYGPHYVHRPTPLDYSKPYDQARMWAGALPETYSSLRVIPREVGDIVILADQQLSTSDLTPPSPHTTSHRLYADRPSCLETVAVDSQTNREGQQQRTSICDEGRHRKTGR